MCSRHYSVFWCQSQCYLFGGAVTICFSLLEAPLLELLDSCMFLVIGVVALGVIRFVVVVGFIVFEYVFLRLGCRFYRYFVGAFIVACAVCLVFALFRAFG
ncbi:hypothetical protein C2G38_2047325 [Gigaspora rosea]|uniref:Uncharacterized protein n=1 Tax=Gigaspora rosea TaxID=44941 RepID=A0A397UEP8_9GLOM|nr:hypothetical protein C2G38_2047325 [Gigaspora rosea]